MRKDSVESFGERSSSSGASFTSMTDGKVAVCRVGARLAGGSVRGAEGLWEALLIRAKKKKKDEGGDIRLRNEGPTNVEDSIIEAVHELIENGSERQELQVALHMGFVTEKNITGEDEAERQDMASRVSKHFGLQGPRLAT